MQKMFSWNSTFCVHNVHFSTIGQLKRTDVEIQSKVKICPILYERPAKNEREILVENKDKICH